MRTLLFVVLNLAFLASCVVAPKTPPLKALLVIGGCCHDYANQKDILKAGLEKRANLKIDIAYSADRNTKPALPIFGNPDYAKGYDVIIHDECSADISDVEIIKGVLAPHRAGIPGVNLHCAVHSYRVGDHRIPAEPGTDRAAWFEYLGLHSSGHGPQLPIAISYAMAKSPITAGFADWTTINEEHYNNVQILPTATVLARGKQTVREKENDFAVVWTNDYRGTRVFTTTIGHNNATVSDAQYLDLVVRGLLWACKKLDASGQPLAGYGPVAAK
ncbi:MAG: ThuA domain-containing protein [Opitutaceae bacterium]